ncbi:MAG: YkoF family thiamine/hydroxymethylpyrimidine-binding protein [Cypionkella sp.]
MTTHVTAQFSLVPASDQFISIILGAVQGISDIEGLSVSTDAVSSQLDGPGSAVTEALTLSFLRAAATGVHVVQPVLLASGEESSTGAFDFSGFVAPPASTVKAFSQFAIFGSDATAQTIDFLTGLGLTVSAKALVTRVDGDAGLVIAAYVFLVERLGGVTLQATLVANLPSAEQFA